MSLEADIPTTLYNLIINITTILPVFHESESWRLDVSSTLILSLTMRRLSILLQGSNNFHKSSSSASTNETFTKNYTN